MRTHRFSISIFGSMTCSSIIIVLAVSCTMPNRVADRENEARTPADELPMKTDAMVNKFDAMTWEGLFGEKDRFKQFFTFEVEDALVSSTKRPIVFCGILHDIARLRGELVVHFATALGVQPPISFLLDSDKAQVDKHIKTRTQDELGTFVVAARI